MDAESILEVLALISPEREPPAPRKVSGAGLLSFQTGMQVNQESHISLFAGKRVLVVEDEYFLADEVRRKLSQLQALVVGPASSVEAALALIEQEEIDAAILDVHLGDEFVFPVAEKLDELDIPFVFATSYDPAFIPKEFSGFTLCEKPTELEKIAKALFASGPSSGMH
ncbi:response regulator [Rhizobium lentis]|nr:response regulator [Rhizobium lentis]